jgi:hypothetical protein
MLRSKWECSWALGFNQWVGGVCSEPNGSVDGICLLSLLVYAHKQVGAACQAAAPGYPHVQRFGTSDTWIVPSISQCFSAPAHHDQYIPFHVSCTACISYRLRVSLPVSPPACIACCTDRASLPPCHPPACTACLLYRSCTMCGTSAPPVLPVGWAMWWATRAASRCHALLQGQGGEQGELHDVPNRVISVRMTLCSAPAEEPQLMSCHMTGSVRIPAPSSMSCSVANGKLISASLLPSAQHAEDVTGLAERKSHPPHHHHWLSLAHRILLVTCHLAAHDEFLERRNADFARIAGKFTAHACMRDQHRVYRVQGTGNACCTGSALMCRQCVEAMSTPA